MLILLFFIGLLTAIWPNAFSFACVFIVQFFLLFDAYFTRDTHQFSIIKSFKTYFYATLAIILGYCWGEIHCHIQMAQKLPTILESKTIVIEGRIASVPDVSYNYTQFQFEIESPVKPVNHEPYSSWHGKIILSWYDKNYYKKYSAPQTSTMDSPSAKNIPQLKVGQKWHFTVKLKRPRGFSNPGSFDYEAWLFEQGILARGYVVDKSNAQNILLEQPTWLYYPIEQIREHIGEMWKDYQNWPFLGVLLALTVGLTSQITAEQWQVFTNTGTIHLISISGFHISLMAGVAFSFVGFLWRRISWFCERFPAQKAAAIAAIVAAIIYSMLAGCSIPTQRSLIMVLVFMGSTLLQRQTNVWESFLYSLLAVILWDPFAPLNMSFWLSFSAVAVILYAIMDPPIHKKPWLEYLKLQWHIFLGLIPFSLFWFSQVSVSSLWANLIAIPVTGFFVLPLALLAIIISGIYFPAAVFLMKISHWFFALLYYFLEWVSREHPVIIAGALDHVWMLLSGVLGILLLLAPKGWPGRWLGFIFLLPLLFPMQSSIEYGEAKMSLLDVGQGLATVVQTQHHTLVFDTGPKLSENFDTGKAVVLPYLRNQHINSVDSLVISHGDMDHRGGMQSVLKGISVKKIVVNDWKVMEMLGLKKEEYFSKTIPKSTLCLPNLSWEWDGVTFQFLTEGLSQFTNTNDRSCVLKISNGRQSALFPGDLESQGERVLIEYYGKLLPSNFIVAGHHGSKTSSSLSWINAVNPDYALFPTGYLNRYHFPNPMIVERYKNRGVKTLSTTDCGMICWTLAMKNKQEMPSCYRVDESRDWY